MFGVIPTYVRLKNKKHSPALKKCICVKNGRSEVLLYDSFCRDFQNTNFFRPQITKFDYMLRMFVFTVKIKKYVPSNIKNMLFYQNATMHNLNKKNYKIHFFLFYENLEITIDILNSSLKNFEYSKNYKIFKTIV